MPSACPLVFVRLLADRQSQFAALHWSVASTDATGLDPWLADPAFNTLCHDLPCLWDEQQVTHWATAAQAALQATGAQSVAADAVAHCADSFAPAPQQPWVGGHWYLQPSAQPSRAQAASRSLTLQLLQLVNNDADTHELEEVFRRDVTLSYQLLRLVNSPALRRPREITSFAQAILLLGRQQLKRWINLLMFAARDDDHRSSMLLAHVSLRAHGMELLAQASGLDRAQQDQAFMTGMFSLLGVLFGTPLPELLQPLALGQDMNAALLRQEGELGTLLRDWQAIEAGDAAQVQTALTERGITALAYNHLLVQTCHWTLGLTRGGLAA